MTFPMINYSDINPESLGGGQQQIMTDGINNNSPSGGCELFS